MQMPWSYDPTGGKSPYALIMQSARPTITIAQAIQVISSNVRSFVSNTDEQVALEADCFAFYKGVPVIKVDALGTSGLSLGFIFLGSKVRSPEVIQHEYGHTVQLSQIGLIDYLIFVGAPSKFYFDKTQQGVYSWSEYYDRPWELLADCFGQVDRTYLPNVQRNAEFYWLIARICSKLT